ncbi:hypothetical protein P7K49_023659 [Saguinus oedipus]|uniref:G-protein coupled receptors family 1 profile domain-containing protein n=1 Tax=Saguinus oedipus TaxID=9490 RepID=A0ABQ9UM99_SAGOE|nr:hypothetical protein P7K49_023659 [Saguinus oedipus]
MPMLSFSHLKRPQWGVGTCRVARPEAYIKCLRTENSHRLAAYTAYSSLVVVGLGCVLLLLLMLVACHVLRLAMLHSTGMIVAKKLHVAALMASGVVFYASSYVPYHIMWVLNVEAQRCLDSHCPNFTDVGQAMATLDLGPYMGYQEM